MKKLFDMKLTEGAIDFIDNEHLHDLITNHPENQGRCREIFAKCREKKPLTPDETAELIAIKDPELLEEMYEIAHELKTSIYGNRIVIFAPLYVGNYCVNDCSYCGFKSSNSTTVRRTLSDKDLENEVTSLEDVGHKRLILVYGEHPKYNADFIAHTVREVYKVHSKNGSIRRVNINAAPLDIKGFNTVKQSGIGTYQVFQETYNRKIYNKYHPINTMKGQFMWRLNAMERAYEGGIDDMGLGALFGLYDWRFEVLSLVSHALHLQKLYGVGPHTLSFPRIQPANGLKKEDIPYLVSDADFKKLVCILRLSVPYTGMIMTAREPVALRDELMQFGISQIDAGTKLEIGGYQKAREVGTQALKEEQFQVGDTRSLDDTVKWLISRDFIPSFCTSCYRAGRTGEHFMEYAIPGFIHNFCTPNAMLTLTEYLIDYATPETKAAGIKLIEKELAKFPQGPRKTDLAMKLQTVRDGSRDIRY
ncbi:MAG: [FeFe] hydrogenase H-cluster radical SAM maturase HydG [Bacteroidales bacterium]